MKDKKKYNKKYYTGGRVDMSKGGRVKAQVGGMQKAPTVSKKAPTMSIEKEEEIRPTVQTTKSVQSTVTPKDVTPVTGTKPVQPTLQENNNVAKNKQQEQMFVQNQEDIFDNGDGGDKDNSDNKGNDSNQRFTVGETRTRSNGVVEQWNGVRWVVIYNPNDPTQDEETPLTDEQKETKFQSDRKTRILETAEQAQQMAQGVMPEDIPTIPDPRKIDRTDTEITPEEAGKLQMKATKEAEAATVGAVSPEQVSIINDVATAKAPEPFAAAKLGDEDISKVPEDAVVEAASGSVSPEVSETLAKAAGVQAVAPIDAAEVEILPGALQDRVVGTISPEAKAQAAKVAGTSLSRITRAKKQLTNAGLSEADIAELGNDPEALEARLADFSEEQRGIIEGLPQEALVSNQLDTLLSGIEEGEIPIWARPAVSQVEQMLAQRGMSASTVGRDSLLNAIIQSAMPMAQANAQAIQASVGQQRAIEAQEAEANAARGQQTALANAQNVFQMDMAQFSSDQQIALSNSKFLQTVGITDATMDQQAIIQDAALMSQANLAEADFNQRTQIQNAQAFLQMDLTNLSNQQQANVLKAQQNQQRVLSNQAAQNAAAQFNAASENQTNQFMSNLQAQMNQYNASQMNAMEQFNATQANAAEARRAGREADLNKFNAQLVTQVDQFNSQQDFARNQWNAQNAAAVEASNVQWRRQANTINTAAQNQINMQNSQNAYGMTMQSQSFLWQELRDQADFDFRAFENEENRKAQIISTAMANEGKSGQVYDDYLTNLLSSVSNSYSGGYTGSYVNFT